MEAFGHLEDKMESNSIHEIIQQCNLEKEAAKNKELELQRKRNALTYEVDRVCSDLEEYGIKLDYMSPELVYSNYTFNLCYKLEIDEYWEKGWWLWYKEGWTTIKKMCPILSIHISKELKILISDISPKRISSNKRIIFEDTSIKRMIQVLGQYLTANYDIVRKITTYGDNL